MGIFPRGPLPMSKRKDGKNMFSRFNLSGLTEEFFGGKNACEKYQKYYREDVLGLTGKEDDSFRKILRQYLQANGNLDAATMEQEWFGSVQADIFLSHSHRDETLIEAFAGWLHEKCGVFAFVDSSLWGYADDLLLEIDNDYCKNDGKNTYSYELRNISTSYVHMILNTALAKMIYQTECLIFVNTENSTIKENISDESKTLSPWIYSELALSKIIEHQKLSVSNLMHSFTLNESEGPQIPIELPAEIEHLDTLTTQHLTDWASAIEILKQNGRELTGSDSLILLYWDLYENRK